MNKIPVAFKLGGKEYSGTLDEVAGAGADVWHLMVDSYYWGRLRKAGEVWYFDESKPAVSHLVDHFAAVVIAWYQ
jgi:hypothetical protein